MQDTGLAIQRAKDKTEEMQARAAAIDELTSTGALEDFTAGDQTQLDRELAQISSASQVDDELAKLKAEVGSGGAAEGDRPPATRTGSRRAPAAAAPSRRHSRPRKPPSRPDPLRRHPLRPQEAEGAGGREAVRALDRGGDARHRVLAQDGRRRRAHLQAALGGRVHLGRRATPRSSCAASPRTRAPRSTARPTRSASSG